MIKFKLLERVDPVGANGRVDGEPCLTIHAGFNFTFFDFFFLQGQVTNSIQRIYNSDTEQQRLRGSEDLSFTCDIQLQLQKEMRDGLLLG